MPATEDGTGYVEDVIVVTMNFSGKQKGLFIRTREPSADEWEKQIIPLLAYKDEPMRFVNIFIHLLDSWNLKHKDGTSIPCTRDGLMGHNIRLVNKILKAWINNGILIVEEEEAEQQENPPEEETEDPFAGHKLTVLDMPLPDEDVKAAG